MADYNDWELSKSRNNRKRYIKKIVKKESDYSIKNEPDFIKIVPKSSTDLRSDSLTNISNHVVISLKKGNKWGLVNQLNEMISLKIGIVPEELAKRKSKKFKNYDKENSENLKDNFSLLLSKRTLSPKHESSKSGLLHSCKTTNKYRRLKYELNDPIFVDYRESERKALNILEKAYPAMKLQKKSPELMSNHDNNLLIVPNNEISLCELCYDAHANLIEHEKCHHKACDSCWQFYFKESIYVKNNKKLKCIYEACKTLMNEDFVKKILPNVDYQQPSEYVKCTQCKKIIKIDFKSSNKTSSCDCYHKICNSCKLENHYPMTCQDFEKFQKNFRDLEFMNVKNCPKCHIMIDKVGGCNHMCCGYCGIEFCWNCEGKYEKTHQCLIKKPMKSNIIYFAFFGAPHLQKLYESLLAKTEVVKVNIFETSMNDAMNKIVQRLRQIKRFEYYQVKFIYDLLVRMEIEMQQIYAFYKNYIYNEMVKFSNCGKEEKPCVYQAIQEGLRFCLRYFKHSQNISSFYDIYQLYLINKTMRQKMEYLLLRIKF